MIVIQICITLLLLSSALICLYYWFLLLSSFFTKKKQRDASPALLAKGPRLALVIPAHNEEGVIGRTLASCQQLAYPSHAYDVFVVADNCSDDTAQVAAGHGAKVLERRDEILRGKGYALAHAFTHILAKDYEAVVVVDADCLIDQRALSVIAAKLQQGHKVLQINNTVENPDQSVMSYVLAVGNYIENTFFYAPKSRLGLAVLLRGTGMVLHADILRSHPWDAHSIVEDVEYSLNLLRSGQRITFVPEVKVASPFPVEQEQLRVQRSRWASGNLSFGRKGAVQLMASGLRQMRWILVDAGWTFLVLSRPLVLLQLAITVAATGALYLLNPAPFAIFTLQLAVMLVVLLIGYFGVGIGSMGLSRKRCGYLALVPLIIVQLVAISLRGVIGAKKEAWARTPR